MKTAAVIIDKWKLPIFKKHLDAGKHAYTEKPGITAGTLLLRVRYEWLATLQPIIEAANTECDDQAAGV